MTRYFVVSNIPVDRIAPGLATIIRKRGRRYSYLYLKGERESSSEHVPDSAFFWGAWLKVNMRKHAPVVREIDELESYVLIRRASVKC